MCIKRSCRWILLVICGLTTKCSSDNTKSNNQVNQTSAVLPDTNKSTNDRYSNKAVAVKVQKDWILVPGVSVGKTVLNEDSKKAYKILGKADGGDAAMGKSVSIWYSNHDSTANSIAIYTVRDTGDAPIALIKQIRVTSPTFKTQQGIHCGSILTSIKQNFALKETETYKDEGKIYKVFSSNKGIAFEMDPQNICVAIIIFEAGKTLPGTYLKFRTTNKFVKNNSQ